MIPAWSFSEGYLSSARVSINEEEEEQTSIPGWRRRMNVFPPHLASSYLSREESLQLHKLGLTAPDDLSSPSKGEHLFCISLLDYRRLLCSRVESGTGCIASKRHARFEGKAVNCECSDKYAHRMGLPYR